MVTTHIQLTVSIVLWIIITITLKLILFKMSSVIIYCHNQLKSLSWIDFSCVFNVGPRSLIHNASAIFCFCLFLSIILKSMVLVFLCNFSMLYFHSCNVWSLPLWSFILLFNEHFPPHNPQWKLVKDIPHDKLNHGYVKSSKSILSLTLKQLLSLALLNATSILVLFGSNLLTHLFIDFFILQPLSPQYGNNNQCIFWLSFSFSLTVLDGTCWACWTCLKTLSITHEG